jgi:UDP-N-acetylglucosamine:LPS N-acetylglucosamine transferase
VGGAGAQVPLAKKLVSGMSKELREGSLRLALVAGRRPEVAKALRDAVYSAGVEVEVLFEPDVFDYFRSLNRLLASADALWSKPSEMTFFAALGLPFISAPPVGVHEQWNLRWGQDHGAALPQHDPAAAGEWLREWVEDGILAAAAEAGRARLPSGGLYEIADEVEKA